MGKAQLAALQEELEIRRLNWGPRMRITSGKARLSALKEELENTTAQLGAKDEELKSGKAQLATLKEELEDTASQLTKTTARLERASGAEQLAADRAQTLSTLNEEKAALFKQLADKEVYVRAQEEKVHELEGTIKR